MSYETLAGAASRIGCDPRTIRRRIASGDLPAFRLGRLIRVRPEDVDALFRPIPSAGNQ